MKKYLIILSIGLNILVVAFFIRRFIVKNTPKPLPISKDIVLKYWLNRQNYLSKLPIGNMDIVFVGDSHTQQFELAEMFQNLHIKNRGINRDLSHGVLDRIHPIINGKPKEMFLMIGVNDVLQNTPVDTTVKNIKNIIEITKNVSPLTKIYIESVLPTNWKIYYTNTYSHDNIVILNHKLHDLSNNENIKYIDLFSLFEKGRVLNTKFDCGDGLHLNYDGYVLWKNAVNKYISQ